MDDEKIKFSGEKSCDDTQQSSINGDTQGSIVPTPSTSSTYIECPKGIGPDAHSFKTWPPPARRRRGDPPLVFYGPEKPPGFRIFPAYLRNLLIETGESPIEANPISPAKKPRLRRERNPFPLNQQDASFNWEDSGLPDKQQHYLRNIQDPIYRRALFLFGKAGNDLRHQLSHLILYEGSRRTRWNFLIDSPSNELKWPSPPSSLEQSLLVLRRPTVWDKDDLGETSGRSRLPRPLFNYTRTSYCPPTQYDKLKDPPLFVNAYEFDHIERDLKAEVNPKVTMDHSLGLYEALEDTVEKMWPQVVGKWKEGPLHNEPEPRTEYPEPVLDRYLRDVIARRTQKRLTDLMDELFWFFGEAPAIFDHSLIFMTVLRRAKAIGLPSEAIERAKLKLCRYFPKIVEHRWPNENEHPRPGIAPKYGVDRLLNLPELKCFHRWKRLNGYPVPFLFDDYYRERRPCGRIGLDIQRKMLRRQRIEALNAKLENRRLHNEAKLAAEEQAAQLDEANKNLETNQ